MRVLQVHPYTNTGGAIQSHISSLVPYLESMNHTVNIYSTGILASELDPREIVNPALHIERYVRSAAILAIKYNGPTPDIIHAHEYKGMLGGVFLSKKLNVPLISTLHGNLCPSPDTSLPLNLISSAQEVVSEQQKYTIYHSKALVTLCQEQTLTVNELLNSNSSFSSRKPSVIQTAGFVGKNTQNNLLKIYRPSISQRFFSSNASASPKVIKILIPGRTIPAKGQLDFIKFLLNHPRILSSEDIIFDFTVLGSGRDYQSLIQLTKNFPYKISIIPAVESNQMSLQYASADVVLNTSNREVYSTVNMEAQLAGCFLLTKKNVGSSEEQVSIGGGACFTDYDDLCALLINLPGLLQDYYSNISSFRNNSANFYSPKNHALKLSNLYNQIADATGK